jgi:hypothetical protein
MKKTATRYFGLILLSWLSLFAMNRYWFYIEIGYRNSIVNIFLFGLILWFSCRYAAKEYDLAVKKGAFIFSLVSTLALVLGNSLYRTGSLAPALGSFGALLRSALVVLGFVWLFYIALLPFLEFLRAWEINVGIPSHRKRDLFVVWGILFLAWLPVWLAYFPGNFAYDAIFQYSYYTGLMDFTSHHPPIHTMFLGLCFDLGYFFGGNTGGAVAYCLIQMLLLSFILAYSLWRLTRQGLNPKIRIAIILFYAFYPVISVVSFTTMKETLFSGVFVLFTVLLVEIYHEEAAFFKRPLKLFALVVVTLLLCLLRNNALYALFVSFIPIAIICRNFWRQILLTLGGALLVYCLISSYGYKLLGINPNPQAEMMSVPSQQMAAVSIKHGDSLSEEEKQAIAALLPIDLESAYNPRYSDTVKNYFNKEVFDDNVYYYARIWLGLFWKYPLVFLDAALDINLAFWYPDAAYNHNDYIDYWSSLNWINGTAITRHSLIPPLFAVYRALAGEGALRNIPVLGFVFNIGAVIWFLFFGLVLCFVKGRPRLTLIFWVPIAYWLTHLAGPVAMLRYMVPLIMCAPICLGVVLQEKQAFHNVS